MIIGLKVDATKLRKMSKEEKRELYKRAEEHSRRLEYEACMCVRMLHLLYGADTALYDETIVKEIGEDRARLLYQTGHLECCGSFDGHKLFVAL